MAPVLCNHFALIVLEVAATGDPWQGRPGSPDQKKKHVSTSFTAENRSSGQNPFEKKKLLPSPAW